MTRIEDENWNKSRELLVIVILYGESYYDVKPLCQIVLGCGFLDVRPMVDGAAQIQSTTLVSINYNAQVDQSDNNSRRSVAIACKLTDDVDISLYNSILAPFFVLFFLVNNLLMLKRIKKFPLR